MRFKWKFKLRRFDKPLSLLAIRNCVDVQMLGIDSPLDFES